MEEKTALLLLAVTITSLVAVAVWAEVVTVHHITEILSPVPQKTPVIMAPMRKVFVL